MGTSVAGSAADVLIHVGGLKKGDGNESGDDTSGCNGNGASDDCQLIPSGPPHSIIAVFELPLPIITAAAFPTIFGSARPACCGNHFFSRNDSFLFLALDSCFRNFFRQSLHGCNGRWVRSSFPPWDSAHDEIVRPYNGTGK